MPRLQVFTACEKVIVDAKGIPSLINLFQRMDVQLQDVPLPKDTIVPGRWAIFCSWQLSPEELGKDFIQHTRVNKPDGTVFSEFNQPFKLESELDLQCRTYVDIHGMPIGQHGRIEIVTWIEGNEKDLYECSFYMQHLPKEEVGETSSTALTSSATD
jgi:hypothetical protein